MPSRPHRPPRRASPAASPVAAVGRPLDEDELETLQSLLDAVPAPLEPLDLSMLDGFLCAVLVQPAPVGAARWLPFVTDIDGRALPQGFDASAMQSLVLRRHAELDAAIAARRWFDPWVFEVDGDAAGDGDEPGDGAEADDDASVHAAVYPWVAGFATGFETFPALSQAAEDELLEPLALLYRHLDPDDIEDGDPLRDVIEAAEPAVDLADAVEGLVRATLLLADLAGRPAPRPSHAPSQRRRPSR
jgi:uncharacterized protein